MVDLVPSEVVKINVLSHSDDWKFILIGSWTSNKYSQRMLHGVVWIALNLTNSVIMADVKNVNLVSLSDCFDWRPSFDWRQIGVWDRLGVIPTQVFPIVDMVQLTVSFEINIVGIS